MLRRALKLAAAGRNAFQPDDLLNLYLWLKADAGVTESGGKVTSWADQSGNSRTASEADVAKQPTKVAGAINGLPVIRGDGGDALVVTANWPVTGTGFLVFSASTVATAQLGIIGASDPGKAGGTYQANSPLWHIQNDSGTLKFLNNWTGYKTIQAISANTPYLLSWDHDDTSGAYRIWLSQSLKVNLTGYDSLNAAQNRIVLLTGYLNPDSGDIGETILYDRVLSDTERGRVETYLKNKWGV